MNNKTKYIAILLIIFFYTSISFAQEFEGFKGWTKGITVGYGPISKLERFDVEGQFNFDNIQVGIEWVKNKFTARFDIYIKDRLIADDNVTALIGLRAGAGINLNANKRFQFPIYGTIGFIGYSNKEFDEAITGSSFGLRAGPKFYLSRKIAVNLGIETEIFSETWENRQVAYVYGAFTGLSFTF